MSIRAEKFTASAIMEAADEADTVSGLAFKGFTAVTVYNGQDNTGAVVIAMTAPGVFQFESPVTCDKGIYVEATGSGSGSVLR